MPDLLTPTTAETPSAVEALPEMSNVEADEQAYEQTAESKEHFLEENQIQEDAPTTTVKIAPSRPAQKPVVRKADEVTLHVEQILERGMGELYAGLPDSAKPIFKKKGEEVSTQVTTMMRSFKVEASKVIRLIRDWLLTIPNVNKFFLEQEAKVKTDALLEYDAARREERKQP
ncbi:MAG: hypothetical protein ABIO72_01825 [Patescibacteria group bacterium]